MSDETRHPRWMAEVDRNDEPISALADGELDRKGAEFLVRRLAGDDRMQRQWQRFHLVRSCMHGECAGAVSLVGRVRAALEGETPPVAAGKSAGTWMRAGFGGAIAASVALVAIVGLANRLDTEATGGADREAGSGFVSQTTALDRQFNAPAVPAGFGADRNADSGAGRGAQERINRYMIRHSQVAGSNGFISLTPVLTAPSTVRVVRPESDPSGDRSQDTAR